MEGGHLLLAFLKCVDAMCAPVVSFQVPLCFRAVRYCRYQGRLCFIHVCVACFATLCAYVVTFFAMYVCVCVCLQPRSYVYDHVLSDPTLFPKFGLPTICENRVRHLLFVSRHTSFVICLAGTVMCAACSWLQLHAPFIPDHDAPMCCCAVPLDAQPPQTCHGSELPMVFHFTTVTSPVANFT